MSSRDKPYRSKASSAFFELVQSALQSTFFLVQESGPTSFALKDEHGKLIKVSLGSTHACTCGGGRSEHCLHTLYVLLKIFRVLPDNPIIWQVSFIDSEINFLIRNRANPIVEKKTIKNQINSQVNRIDLKEEFGCPICQEDLKESDVLIFCKVGCGHNFHVKCMKMWAEYKVSQKENISCPLCRCNWGNSVLNELQRLEHKTKKKKAIHSSTACLGCGASPITGPKYHCLICPDFDFCSKCYNCAHKEHPFIKKLTPSSKWESCPRVNPESLANREFSPNDYELLQQLDSKPCLSEYLFSALPDSAPDVCHLCKNELPGRWKRLACGHSAHDVSFM
jgi:E3 ubiquitin-protein ligase ZSWIM2